MAEAVTCDAFLGGRVRLWQPEAGYRAGVDPVLLAAACPARPGDAVLELGCGAGAAMLCLAARVPGLALTGVERDPAYAALARRNAAENRAAVEVVEADLAALPPGLRARSYAHAIMNPPYFNRAHGSASPSMAREAAMGEDTPMAEWAAVAARRLVPGGSLTIVQRAERLPDMLAALGAAGTLGSHRILPLAPRAGRPARLVILQSRKGGRAAPALLAPFVLHAGDSHLADGDDYTPAARAVLREGAGLEALAGGAALEP